MDQAGMDPAARSLMLRGPSAPERQSARAKYLHYSYLQKQWWHPMCEILAVNANVNVPVTMAWNSFRSRGKGNPDGWGLAYISDGSFHVEKYPQPLLSDSRSIGAAKPIRTNQFLSHVRNRVTGSRSEENTQPFVDQDGHFAISSTMVGAGIGRRSPIAAGHDIRGQTGCEVLFHLLIENGVRQTLSQALRNASLPDEASVSFVFSDGETQYAFQYNRPLYWITRKPPHDRIVHFNDPDQPEFEANLKFEKGDGEVATLIASTRLTNEEWNEIGHRELLVVSRGEVIDRKQF